MLVYLEIGKKRAFAGAQDWPGWCRSGRDGSSALQALFECGQRYAQVVEATGLSFRLPENLAGFEVVERLVGNAVTDFGAPAVVPSCDGRALDDDELQRLVGILRACWAALDKAIATATGRELRLGPRGGGRSLERIVEHVLDGEAGYLGQLGWKAPNQAAAGLDEKVQSSRLAVLDALAAGEPPSEGPRGGTRWRRRYFVRRAAWHVLDHAWEIEDRVMG